MISFGGVYGLVGSIYIYMYIAQHSRTIINYSTSIETTIYIYRTTPSLQDARLHQKLARGRGFFPNVCVTRTCSTLPLCLFSLSLSFYDWKQYTNRKEQHTMYCCCCCCIGTIFSGGYYTYYCVDVCDIPPENRLIDSEKVLSQKKRET